QGLFCCGKVVSRIRRSDFFAEVLFRQKLAVVGDDFGQTELSRRNRDLRPVPQGGDPCADVLDWIVFIGGIGNPDLVRGLWVVAQHPKHGGNRGVREELRGKLDDCFHAAARNQLLAKLGRRVPEASSKWGENIGVSAWCEVCKCAEQKHLLRIEGRAARQADGGQQGAALVGADAHGKRWFDDDQVCLNVPGKLVGDGV